MVFKLITCIIDIESIPEVTKMEMEHINQNLIKVVITADDLAERGVNFLDLVSGHHHIERFFYSILEEVDKDHYFRDSDAVTFQVIPVNEGIELYISRNDWDEDSPSMDSELMQYLRNRQQELYGNGQTKDSDSKSESSLNWMEKLLEKELGKAKKQEKVKMSEKQSQKVEYVVRFKQLEDFLSMARNLTIFPTKSDLYFYKDQYYMVLNLRNKRKKTRSVIYYNALEFGEITKIKPIVLNEHGKLIRENDAVQFASEYL